MRLFLLIILILSFSHCSFDNKTGIWTNNQETVKKKEDKLVQRRDRKWVKKKKAKLARETKMSNIMAANITKAGKVNPRKVYYWVDPTVLLQRRFQLCPSC